MAKIFLTLPENTQIQTGTQITFKAPCDCASITAITVNEEDYQLVDTCGNSVSTLPDVFSQGAMVSVILDVEAKTAYIQSASSAAASIQDENSAEALAVYVCETQEEFDALEQKANTLYMVPSTFEQDTSNTIAELNTKIDELTTKIDELTTKIANLETKHQKDYKYLLNRISGLEAFG